jgi:polyisoprenoid-binding protein YceI
LIGRVLFDAAGLPLACSRFDVDLRTLASDEPRRDNYLYGNTLETEQYLLATFVLTGVEDLDGPLADGEETTFTLVGELTMHCVTNLVTWDVTATLDGDTLSGSAVTRFNMPEYNIEEPVVGPVLSVNETIQLEVDITATRAS